MSIYPLRLQGLQFSYIFPALSETGGSDIDVESTSSKTRLNALITECRIAVVDWLSRGRVDRMFLHLRTKGKAG